MRTAAKPSVTPQLIAKTALEIIDREGLVKLSTHRVARELGIRAPSLYYHFRAKEEILTAVARLILLDMRVLPEPRPRQWRSWMLQQCVEFRRAILKHPNGAPLLLGYIPRELFTTQYERTSLILDRAGVPLDLHVLIFEAVDKLTVGSAMYAASTLHDPAFFPDLDRAATPTIATAVDVTSWTVEDVFARAIKRFLDSIPSTATTNGRSGPPVSKKIGVRRDSPRRGMDVEPSRHELLPPSRPFEPRSGTAEVPKPTSMRRLIAITALELIDAEGLNSVSVKKVAASLGIRGPSVYHYYADKSEIMTAVARLVLLETPVVADPVPSEWREWEVRQSLGYRRAILNHPNAAPLLLGYRPRQLFASVYERVARILVAAGVPFRYHLVVFETTDKFTLGSAMYAASTAPEPEFFPHFDSEQMPMLTKALRANRWDSEEVFVEALRYFLAVIPDGRRQLR